MQLKSFSDFLQLDTPPEERKNDGLYKVFAENFPITDTRNNFVLEFLDYFIDPPRYTIAECLERGLTYSVPLKAKMKLYCTDPDHEDFGTFIQDVFLGTIPYMTANGTFVINGAERVVVSQLHRSPGVFFGQSMHTNGTKLYSARIIPFKGSWIEYATAINNVMKNAQHPFTAIIGGSKVSSKLGVIKNLLDKVDNLIIVGGMGYTFIKALGGKIGMSLHEDDLIPEALNVIQTAKEKGVNLSLSVATVCAQEFSNDAPRKIFPINDIPDDWEGMDAAPASLENWEKIILASKTILWTGPVGVFELENFSHGTGEIAKCGAHATQVIGAFSLVGGGDSVAAVNKFGLADKVSYVSTGGGAMLEAIEGKVLPGVVAIEK